MNNRLKAISSIGFLSNYTICSILSLRFPDCDYNFEMGYILNKSD